ncbi:hypothetical protein [uncultured Thiocystis sp.]|uniref:hypothetical protein n=1 Tax=uncultured Thiocystis sp. TaxID=1202134 RepID=UPI0025D86E0C|nr:hypothetical protein [uncultured Thiocystis sp.]
MLAVFTQRVSLARSRSVAKSQIPKSWRLEVGSWKLTALVVRFRGIAVGVPTQQRFEHSEQPADVGVEMMERAPNLMCPRRELRIIGGIVEESNDGVDARTMAGQSPRDSTTSNRMSGRRCSSSMAN